MNKVNVYLSGACKNVNKDFQVWRNDFVKLTLEDKYDYEVVHAIDPISHFNYSNHQPPTDRACKDLFYYFIDKSDLLIVNLDNSKISPGTVAEVHHAFIKGIPVIGFGTNIGTWYPWTKDECSVILNNINDVYNYITEHYVYI